jgi:pimeloyl-ACP methyl ester carboxylesterase
MSETTSLQTVLVCHGAWYGGWAWQKMRPLMHAAGYHLITPTYTGLGERTHLATPDIGLDTAVHDVLNVIHYEDLRDVILIGHSFGGMVATSVADLASERIAQLIYLDAFVPRDGQSLFDVNEPLRQRLQALMAAADAWLVPPVPTVALSPDISAADAIWSDARLADVPLKFFSTKVRLLNGEPQMPRSYIRCTHPRPNNPFAEAVARAKSEPGWSYFELDASHSPNLTAPRELMHLLQAVMTRRIEPGGGS